MSKVVSLSAPIVNFEGDALRDDSGTWTLRKVLLTYCRNSHAMGLAHGELADIYGIGCKIGVAEDSLHVTDGEFAILKRMVNNGRTQKGEPLLPLELQFGAIQILEQSLPGK